MSSASKTLKLLAYFSPNRPEIGLSEMCRLAKRDKATTYRHLQALEEAGFVEQSAATKMYRLGPALLQLAQVREATVPRHKGAETALAALSEETGETAHVTVLSGTTVYPLLTHESQRHSTRAIVDLQTFALHATASGLCALGFGADELINTAIERMEAFTSNTVTTSDALHSTIKRVRKTGFGWGERSYEDDIQAISAPIFDQSGTFAGAVAVACVASRFTPELKLKICQSLTTASREITRNWGGTLPPSIETSWADFLSNQNAMETTS